MSRDELNLPTQHLITDGQGRTYIEQLARVNQDKAVDVCARIKDSMTGVEFKAHLGHHDKGDAA